MPIKKRTAKSRAFNDDHILQYWWVFGGKYPCVKPWNMPFRGGPGSRPWAWLAFDAPEDFDGEIDLATLGRLGMLLPGEAEAAR